MTTTTDVDRIPRDTDLTSAVALNQARHDASMEAKRGAAGLIINLMLQSLTQHNRNHMHDQTLSVHMGDRTIDQIIISGEARESLGELLGDFNDVQRSEIRQLVFEDLQADHPTSGYMIRWSKDFVDRYFRATRPV